MILFEALATFAATVLVYRSLVRPLWRYLDPPKPRRYTKERGRLFTWPPDQRGNLEYHCIHDIRYGMPAHLHTEN